jgi:hypothetical protein
MWESNPPIVVLARQLSFEDWQEAPNTVHTLVYLVFSTF